MFSDMNGKTLPELWDSYAGSYVIHYIFSLMCSTILHTGSGFTDYSPAEMISQAKQVMVATLAPEMRALLTEGISEDDNQNAWTIAIGKIEYRNLCAAQRAGGNIVFALTGEPDEDFHVPAEHWRDYVFRTDLFTSSGKLNGASYRKDQLEKILNRPVTDSEIDRE
jgi:hypothetical protein